MYIVLIFHLVAKQKYIQKILTTNENIFSVRNLPKIELSQQKFHLKGVYIFQIYAVTDTLEAHNLKIGAQLAVL